MRRRADPLWRYHRRCRVCGHLLTTPRLAKDSKRPAAGSLSVCCGCVKLALYRMAQVIWTSITDLSPEGNFMLITRGREARYRGVQHSPVAVRRKRGAG